MRLFISINLHEQNVIKLETLQNQLSAQGVNAYWRNRENLHVTLKFLGEIPQHQYLNLQQILHEASRTIGPFTLQFHSMGVFPNTANPKILWVGIKEEPKLYLLYQAIEEVIWIKLGIPKEKRKYIPHLTIASGRIFGLVQRLKTFQYEDNFQQEVSEFCLMNSLVVQGVRKYTILEKYPT